MSQSLKNSDFGISQGDGQNGRLWRHPADQRIVLPKRFVAAVALMQLGVDDFSVIADSVGLELNQVKQIDAAQAPAVRALAVKGIPAGQFFKLRTRVRCPRCRSWIDTAPCVACANNHA